jgi:integrase
MAVYKRKDRDTWVARLSGPDGRLVQKNFARKTDAVRWHSEQLAARERGDFIDPRDGKVTLARFYEQWSARQVWERGTERAMSLAVRTCSFADVPLARIRRSHVETWVKQMSVDLAPSTVKTRYGNVRNVLRAAVRDRLIGTDPSEGVVLPRQRRREIAMEVPTAEQLRAILDAASNDFMPFLALCAFAGLRLGEAAALQVGDIDFMRRTIKVRRQVQRAGGKLVEIRKAEVRQRARYLRSRCAAVHPVGAHRPTRPHRSAGSVAVHGRDWRPAAASERRGNGYPPDLQAGGRRRLHAPLAAALLRLDAAARWRRCRDGPASDGTWLGSDDPAGLRPLDRHCRRSHPAGRSGCDGGGVRKISAPSSHPRRSARPLKRANGV